MTKIHTLAAAVALSLAALSVQAADVQLYGRVDEGLRYTRTHGQGDDSSTLEMRHNRATSRWGLNITEQISPDLKAKVYLESGFYSDTGEFDNSKNQIFQRRSILALQGKWGELGAGRFGTVQSTMGPYSMGLLNWDPYATSYGQASIGSTFANTGRVNNGLNWISPSMAGWRVGASYSLGDSSDDDYATYADRDHTLALAVDYKSENIYFSVAASNVAYGNAEHKEQTKDGQTFGLGGWYAVTPSTRIYAAAQYQKHWDTAAGLSTSDLTAAGLNNPDDLMAGGFDGYSVLLGATHTIGNNKFLGEVQYFDGKFANDSSADYKFTVLSAAWEYKLAKRIWYYVAATHSFDGGSISDIDYAVNADAHQCATEFMTGIQMNF